MLMINRSRGDFPSREVPRNWHVYCDQVTDNFRVIVQYPKPASSEGRDHTMTTQQRFIECDDPPVHLRATAFGEGQPVVLLPGLGRAPSDLAPLADILANAGYSVLLPEPRGIGASRGPLEGLTLHDLATDVATLLERWTAGPATIVGHAFGNRIARTLAADWPGLVSAVVLLSSSGKVQPTPEIVEAIRLAQAIDTPPDRAAGLVRAGIGRYTLAGWLVAAGHGSLPGRGSRNTGRGMVDRGQRPDADCARPC